MPHGPHTSYFEILPGGESKKLGTLCTPVEVFALAAAMSFSQTRLISSRFKETAPKNAIDRYMKRMSTAPPEVLRMFDWYCQVAQDSVQMTGIEEWNEKAGDFSRSVRAYLVLLLFYEAKLERPLSQFHLEILTEYRRIFQQILKDWDQRPSLSRRVLRCLFYPLDWLIRKRSWRYERIREKKKFITAVSFCDNLLELCASASNEGRIFSFEYPRDGRTAQATVNGAAFSDAEDGTLILGSSRSGAAAKDDSAN